MKNYTQGHGPRDTLPCGPARLLAWPVGRRVASAPDAQEPEKACPFPRTWVGGGPRWALWRCSRCGS